MLIRNVFLRRGLWLAAMMPLLTAPACNRSKRMRVQTEEEPPRAASMLSVADPRAGSQLVTGWYALEQNAWRWTAGKFSVVLRPPRGADQNGAVLKLKFALPGDAIKRIQSTTLSAKVNGVDLAPETYSKAGDYVYTRDVPASALGSATVKVDFALDKFLAAGVVEGRELGVIASMVGFESK